MNQPFSTFTKYLVILFFTASVCLVLAARELFIGLTILESGTFVYRKVGSSVINTVTPTNGRFEFFYQVVFQFSFAATLIFVAIFIGLGAYVLMKAKSGTLTEIKGCKRFALIVFFIVGVFACLTWITLRIGQYWLL